MNGLIKPRSIGIIIVHYKNIDYTFRCISSFKKAISRLYIIFPEIRVKILIVDNSFDLDELILKKNVDFVEIFVIRPNRNLGYAGGIVFGAKLLSDVDFYLFCNNDLTVEQNLLVELLNAYKLATEPGAIQPKVLNRDGTLIDSVGLTSNPLMHGFMYSHWLVKLPNKATNSLQEVFGVEGMLIFISKEVWQKVGGWDPEFFMFGEDLLLSWKLRLAGFKNYLAPRALAYHIRGGAVAGVILKREPLYTSYYTSRNKLLSVLYLYKKWWLIKYFALTLLFEISKNLFLAMYYRNARHFTLFLSSFQYILRNTKRIIENRRNILQEFDPSKFLKGKLILSFTDSVKLIIRRKKILKSSYYDN